MVELILLVGH